MKQKSKTVVMILCGILSLLLFASCGSKGFRTVKEIPEPTTEGLEYLPFDDGTLAVAVGQAVNVRKMVIPKTHEGKIVRAIAMEGFKDCENITELLIPNTVILIGKSAFSGCRNLKSVKIGTSVTSIETNAFDGCSSLTNVTIPNSVTNIGWSAFCECSNLTEITISDSVTSIAEQERLTIRQRQREGIDAMPIDSATGKRISAKTGKVVGRPKAVFPDNWDGVYSAWRNSEFSGRHAMELLGLKPNTFYKLVREYENGPNMRQNALKSDDKSSHNSVSSFRGNA